MTHAIDLRGLVRPQLVESTKREDHPNVAEFRLQPLERGFGHTLGNAMRRILRIGVSKAGAVTAGHIEAQGGVRVIEPSHHLFTMQDERDLSVELYVNKGRGYVEAEQHPADRSLPVDLVRIDSIYSPVRRVNFSVSETRVGQRTDYDRLVLTVETNGTISPEEAVSYAAALAQTHFQYFAGFGSHAAAATGAEFAGSDAARLAQLLKTPIDDLELSVRSVNSLKNFNIRSLGDLVRQTETEILEVKNFGKKSLQEIADLLEREGLNFGMRFEENGDGVHVIDWGTPASRAAANAPDDLPEE